MEPSKKSEAVDSHCDPGVLFRVVKSAADGPLHSREVTNGPDRSNITQIGQEMFGSRIVIYQRIFTTAKWGKPGRSQIQTRYTHAHQMIHADHMERSKW